MLSAAVGTDEVARRLVDLLSRTPREAVAPAPLPPGDPPARVAAVDGSNVTLAESGAHLVGAWRVGRVDLARGALVHAMPRPPEVGLLVDKDVEPLRSRLAAAGVSVESPRLAAGAMLEHLRTLAELGEALDAVEALGPRDLLLLDGALQARTAIPLMDRLAARARVRGVDLVGVCKSTSLTVGPAPALVACRLAARDLGATPWCVEIPAPPAVRGRVFVARLSAAEPRPFRFDVAAADDDPRRVLGSLATLAGHPAYPGYPSPLAMAHNAALLSEQDRLRLRATLHEACVKAGVAEDDWDAAFLDYHEVLELGA